jgi:three-Cys-motif partner protein
LQQIENQIGNIFQQQAKVNICFNEYNKEKFTLLKNSCKQYLDHNQDIERAGIKIFYYNEDFAELFPRALQKIKKYPSLIYLDQNGIKFLSDKYFLELEKTKTTDFLYYLSSSYILRFGSTKEFQDNLTIDMNRAKQNPYRYIHKSILEQLRERLPAQTKLSLYPFTIRKNTNIYGIIFGASHLLAVDKFLKTAWERNTVNGEANFDIDDDASKNQYHLFDGKKLTKIESFAKSLRESILNKTITTNKDALDFTYKHGHISAHATEEIKKMRKEGLIIYSEKTSLVNYEQVYKNKRIIEFKIIQ